MILLIVNDRNISFAYSEFSLYGEKIYVFKKALTVALVFVLFFE